MRLKEEMTMLNKKVDMLEKKVDDFSQIKEVITRLAVLSEKQEQKNEEFELIFDKQIKISEENFINLKNIADSLYLLNNKMDNLPLLINKKGGK